MITNVTSTTSTGSASDQMKSSLGMNSSDFMKLFVAQLQYQDPLKPQDSSAMLDQLSQMTLVEQSYNNSTALNSLIAAQNNSVAVNSASFIGGTVKANGNAVNFDGSTSPTMKFSQNVASTSGTVTITNSAGTVVRTAALGALSAGNNSYTWNGCDNNGTALSSGAYTFKVTGTSATGADVAVTTYTTGVVDGVSFSNNTPTLSIGAVSVPITDIISVKAG